jgi:hypothetical protein
MPKIIFHGAPSDWRFSGPKTGPGYSAPSILAAMARITIKPFAYGRHDAEIIQERPSSNIQMAPTDSASTSAWAVATASAPGTCGELVQGLLPDGINFHITCPIRKRQLSRSKSALPMNSRSAALEMISQSLQVRSGAQLSIYN